MSGGRSKGGRGADDWIDFPAANEIDALAKDALKAFHHRQRGWQGKMASLFRALSANALDHAMPDAPHIPIEGPHLVGVFAIFSDMLLTAQNGGLHPLAEVAPTGGRDRLSAVQMNAKIAMTTAIGLARSRAKASGQKMDYAFELLPRELRPKGVNVDAKFCRSTWTNLNRLPENVKGQIKAAVSDYAASRNDDTYQKLLWDAAAAWQAMDAFLTTREIKSKDPIL